MSGPEAVGYATFAILFACIAFAVYGRWVERA